LTENPQLSESQNQTSKEVYSPVFLFDLFLFICISFHTPSVNMPPSGLAIILGAGPNTVSTPLSVKIASTSPAKSLL
jgi:hypothetical protein